MKSHDITAHTLSLVIPMYNEVDNVVPMLDRVHEVLGSYPHPWELVLVDDGSSDGTAEAIRRESAVRALYALGLKISSISDVTPVPHNVCRPPKRRRI